MKKKIIAGAVTVGLLTGAGFSLANTDAGQALKTWYDNLFNQTSAEVLNESDANFEQLLTELRAENEALKELAASQIDEKTLSEIEGSTLAINQAKYEHITSLDSEKLLILENMDYQFYQLFLEGYFHIKAKGDLMQEEATANFQAFASEKGQSALEQVTAELNQAKADAVTELEQEIVAAKQEIVTKVESQVEISSRNLRSQANWKAEEIREALDAILANLVAEQEAAITAKAAELEADAKTSLDDVVNNIVND